ncbi:DNA-directed RNA polymerase sigma-70 factor [Fulvitalea axinellae]|uniref:DNA-directed RNA polymerase sigma-70 factor n=1 Tax=Fulvitalea axinellae TaxID=1182444 RepID=A0AAU9CKA3_9BACT|nr:DNA-directed RNA polymerase sigma-70 factor [Fulvitalea axinellae]
MLTLTKSVNENDLIEGCRRNDRRCQKGLYEKYAPVMLGVCMRYVSDRAEAETVMLKAFMKAFERIDSFEGRGAFGGWLRRIMVNESLNYLRQNKSLFLETDIDLAEFDETFGYEECKAEADDLLRIINELPSGYKAVFNLYAIEGYSHDEIGEKLGISTGTSKSQLSRARALLKKKLMALDYAVKQVRS